MAQTFAFEDLKEILVNRVGLPEDAVLDDPQATFEDMGMDSLAAVELQLTVQQDYGFAIPDEDAGGIATVGDAIEYVNRRIAEEA